MSNAEQNTQQLQHKVNYSKQTNIKKKTKTERIRVTINTMR